MNIKIPKNIRSRFYRELHRKEILYEAWKYIQNSINSSKNQEMKEKAEKFKKNEDKYISELQQQLKAHTFDFSAKATPIKKAGKKKERPVVNLDTIEGRIVQKCILEILQAQNKIQKYLQCEVSYGGLKKKNVAMAIEKIYENIRDKEHIYAIVTDIASFFTKIKKDDVISKIKEFCNDNHFLSILDKAIDLDISNLEDIRKNKDRAELYQQYIYSDEGVPQGSCLSPLFGNIYLYALDQKMLKNKKITYIRYIDDVIILSNKSDLVLDAFNSLLVPELKKLNLSVSIEKTTNKYINVTVENIEYLGVNISLNRITPSSKARNKIINDIKQTLDNALNDKAKKKKSLFDALNIVDKKIKGWAHHYSFCHAQNEMNGIDTRIDKLIKDFYEKYQKRLENLSSKELRNELGIQQASKINTTGKDIIANYKRKKELKKTLSKII